MIDIKNMLEQIDVSLSATQNLESPRNLKPEKLLFQNFLQYCYLIDRKPLESPVFGDNNCAISYCNVEGYSS